MVIGSGSLLVTVGNIQGPLETFFFLFILGFMILMLISNVIYRQRDRERGVKALSASPIFKVDLFKNNFNKPNRQ